MAKLEWMENKESRTRNFNWLLVQRPDGSGSFQEFAGRVVLLESIDEVFRRPRVFRPAQGTRWRDIMLVMWGVLVACTIRLILQSI